MARLRTLAIRTSSNSGGCAGDQLLLTRLSALLRLAEHLDRGRDGAVVRARLRDQGERLELELAVDGDPALARWGAERQSDLFRKAFGRPLTLA